MKLTFTSDRHPVLNSDDGKSSVLAEFAFRQSNLMSLAMAAMQENDVSQFGHIENIICYYLRNHLSQEAATGLLEEWLPRKCGNDSRN